MVGIGPGVGGLSVTGRVRRVRVNGGTVGRSGVWDTGYGLSGVSGVTVGMLGPSGVG